MGLLKSLAKDTALYGLSSIVGRFLNYLLVPLYTAVMPASSGEYGVVTYMYALTALGLAVLTFGMETAFFRFANRQDEDPMRVYTTALVAVGSVATAFVALFFLFLHPIAGWAGYADHPEYLAMMVIVLALDAFASIPFVLLRYQGRALKFATLKTLNIVVNIGLNLFVFLACPKIHAVHPEWIAWFYTPDYLAGYVFAINLACSLFVVVMLARELTCVRWTFDAALFRRMLRYSYPILILGIAGVLNQCADKLLYPHLVPGEEGRVQLGIYGACSKIAMIMAMATQAFRYAYEPIIFGRSADKDDVKAVNALGTKYFVMFTLLGFLLVVAWLDVFKVLLVRNADYWEGLGVVPIVMAAEICMGIYFNLSFWYKLNDETLWGALFSVVGCAVLVAGNVIFVPRVGYVACAWSGLAGYATCMLLSYVVGQRRNPIAYDLRSIGLYAALAVVLYVVMVHLPLSGWWLVAARTLLVGAYVGVLLRRDFPIDALLARAGRR